MLYVSTRNTENHYTAHRALYEDCAPDGGFYVPFRLPSFTAEEMLSMKFQSSGENIAQVLNLFFGLHLNGWDVECIIGRNPFQSVAMNHRLIMSEVWHNPQNSWQYLIDNLYGLITEHKRGREVPSGWNLISIEIALLFGLFSTIDGFPDVGYDIALNSGDFADLTAVLYAKDMGLPVKIIICACNDNGNVWDFIHRGDYNPNAPVVKTNFPNMDISCPHFMELMIYRYFGSAEVKRFLDIHQRKAIYRIDAEQLDAFSGDLFAAVVTAKRIDSIISSMYRTNQYRIDAHTALAYGGLQDYRARTGFSKDTLILVKNKLKTAKE